MELSNYELVRYPSGQLIITKITKGSAFRDVVGFPIVAKPPDGAGAQATFRLDTLADFDNWLTMAVAVLVQPFGPLTVKI